MVVAMHIPCNVWCIWVLLSVCLSVLHCLFADTRLIPLSFYCPHTTSNDAKTISPENTIEMCVQINSGKKGEVNWRESITMAATTIKSLVFDSLRSLSSAWIVIFHSTLQINDSIYCKTFPYSRCIATTICVCDHFFYEWIVIASK